MLTQEDYKKIQQYLQANAVKDTDFDLTTSTLQGNEYIVFIQNGENVRAYLKDFVEQLTLLGAEDVVNATAASDSTELSLTEAIDLIPAKGRKLGQIVTFLDDSGEWKLYQFKGSSLTQWYETSVWEDIIATTIAENSIVADEEDLTAVVEGSYSVVKFKDKVVDEDNYSSIGVTILRKNETEVIDNNTSQTVTKNLLSQSAVSVKNTEYIIKYDYDLNGETVTIPEGCKLIFQGGTITNGVLVGNSTVLNLGIENTDDFTLEGTWTIDNVYDWEGEPLSPISDEEIAEILV